MIRLVIYGLLAYVIYRWWKKSFQSKEKIARKEERKREHLEGAELVQDPECGVYFVKDRAVTLDMNGKTYYFCSNECREKFLKKKDESS